jgi:hypothetical protein
MKQRVFATFLSLSTLGVGCADLEDPGLAASSEGISGGSLVSSTDLPYAAVVSIGYSSKECTATKIGEFRFLTAGHCVLELGLKVGSGVGITAALDGFGGFGSAYIVDNAWVHPSYAQQAGPVRTFDIGVFDITERTPEIPWLSLRDAYVDSGALGLVVGYGTDDDSFNDGQKQESTLKALSLGALMNLTLDDEASDRDVYAHDIALEGPDTTGQGDSGAPVLYQTREGKWEVGGVVRGRYAGLPLSRATRVAGMRSWIGWPLHDVFGNNAWGVFLNAKSNLCAAPEISVPDEGAEIRQRACDLRDLTSDAASWRLVYVPGTVQKYQIVNAKTGKCLALSSASDGSVPRQITCAASGPNGNFQTWKFENHSQYKGVHRVKIVNTTTGKCLGIDGASLAHEARLVQYPCGGSLNQGWTFLR